MVGQLQPKSGLCPRQLGFEPPMGARGPPSGPEELTARPQTPLMTQMTVVTSAGPGPEPDASRLLTVVGDSESPRAALSLHFSLRGSARLRQAHAGWRDPQHPPGASSSPLGMDPYPEMTTDREVLPCRLPGEGGEGRYGGPGGRGTRAALRSWGSWGLVSPTQEDRRPECPGQGGGTRGHVLGPRSRSGGPGTQCPGTQCLPRADAGRTTARWGGGPFCPQTDSG